MSLEGEILSIVGEKWKNLPLLGRTREWYRYQKLVVPVPVHNEGLVPVLIKVVPVPKLPTTLFLYPLHC